MQGHKQPGKKMYRKTVTARDQRLAGRELDVPINTNSKGIWNTLKTRTGKGAHMVWDQRHGRSQTVAITNS